MRQYLETSTLDSEVGFARAAWLTATSVSVIILILTAVTPWIGDGPGAIIRHAFQTLCHQQADRSFGFAGTPFAVCHRCFGIYAGIASGLAIGPVVRVADRLLRRRPVAVLLVAVVPLVADWSAGVLGIFGNTPLTRVLTGFAAGVVGGLFLSSAFTSQRGASSRSEQLNKTMS